MTAEEFERRIFEWARKRSDIVALIQIGSRVQPGGYVDQWSDWDYHLISTRPQLYHGTAWLSEIASPWCAHYERSIRGSIKVTAIFEGALEVDFVPLAAWQMKLVYWAMRRPQWAKWMPEQLLRGISETRVILLGSGSRVWIGGLAWERRLTALQVSWPILRMRPADFNRHVGAFWQKAVWVMKKIARPESRSAMHWMHKMIVEHVYALLEEEAWLAGRISRPEALKAEKWLDARRLAQTAIATDLGQKRLAMTLLSQVDLFEEVSASIARTRGFIMRDHAAVSIWLKSELGKIIAQAD